MRKCSEYSEILSLTDIYGFGTTVSVLLEIEHGEHGKITADIQGFQNFKHEC